MTALAETREQPAVGVSDWLVKRALCLLEPVMASMEPSQARIAMTGRASDHDARADRLESVARPFHLYALLARHHGDSLPAEWRAQFIECLRIGTDPASPVAWGPATNFHQHVVEMGLLVLSLEICRETFWECLDAELREQVLDWLESGRSVAMHWNNHLFFGIFTLAFLRKEGRGRSGDAMLLDGWFREMETMYRGEGWFRDGLNDSSDFYNAYAFHYYGLNWCLFFAESNDSRRERWMGWAHEFLESYPLIFARDGSVPGFGRSQIYRFASLAPFGPAMALDCCPVPAAHLRRLTETHLDYFLEADAITPEGWLNIGWTSELPAIAESYSCTASCYWASKGFSLLLLPPEHPFWQAEAASLEETYADGTRHLPGVGLTLRRFAGDTEILNSGTAVSLMNLRYFASKWSKLAYRASAGTVLPDKANPWPADLSLLAEFDGVVNGRHVTYPTSYGDDSMSCAYTLGEKTQEAMAGVETFVAWKGPWLYIEHRVRASARCRLQQGGFALGYASGETKKEMRADETCLGLCSPDGRWSLIQGIDGFDKYTTQTSGVEAEQRHTLFPKHAIPVASRTVPAGVVKLACLVYFGHDNEQAMPWKIRQRGRGFILMHPYFGEWQPR